MRVRERNKDKAKRGGGTFRSLRGHRLRKKSSRIGERRRESPGPSVEGEAREVNGGRGRRGGGCLRMCEKKTRVGGIRTLRVGSRPRMREEVIVCQICSSTSTL